MMTNLGPRLVSADQIALSIRMENQAGVRDHRGQIMLESLENQGTATNPFIITTGEQFNRFLYAEATRAATEAGTALPDFESFIFHGHMRLVNNISLRRDHLDGLGLSADFPITRGILHTYKITFFGGDFDGNGLNIREIAFDTGASTGQGLTAVGLFSKIEYATVRHLNLEFVHYVTSGVTPHTSYSVGASGAVFAGGLAGVAINSNIIDINVFNGQTGVTRQNAQILGGHIVGGVVGMVMNFDYDGSRHEEARIENVFSNVPVFNDKRFTDYIHPAFPTANPGRYLADDFRSVGVAGGLVGMISTDPRVWSNPAVGVTEYNLSDKLMKRRNGTEVPFGDAQENTGIHIRNVGNFGNYTLAVGGEIVGGLFGVVGPGIRISNADYIATTAQTNLWLNSLMAKFYAGGIVGANWGDIENSRVEIVGVFNVRAHTNFQHSVGVNSSRFIFTDAAAPNNFWGMTVGGVAGFNAGTIHEVETRVTMRGEAGDGVSQVSFLRLFAVGGVAGQNNGGTITNNIVNLPVFGGFYLGGLVGINIDGGTITGNIVHAAALEGTTTGSVQFPSFAQMLSEGAAENLNIHESFRTNIIIRTHFLDQDLRNHRRFFTGALVGANMRFGGPNLVLGVGQGEGALARVGLANPL